MQTSKHYREMALDSLKGKWGTGAIALIVFYLITGAVSSIDYAASGLGSILSLFVGLPMSWGLACIFLSFSRNEEASVGNLFDGFKDYGRVFITMLLLGVYTVLWTLLLIVPGIIKSYSYMMTPYVLKDNPEMSGNAAIEESMRLMDGHKMDLFILHLTFIGWVILACLTLGIGFLFLVPYIETAQAHFYEELKAEMSGAPRKDFI